MPVVNVLLAIDAAGGIGLAGYIPWKGTPFSNADLAHFKALTMNNIIVMGRKTFDSIGRKPLPGRLNVVVTRSSSVRTGSLSDVNLIFAKSVQEAIGLADIFDVSVIGGAEILQEVFNDNLWDYIYVTRVPHDYGCDVTIEIPTNCKLVDVKDLLHHPYRYSGGIVEKYKRTDSTLEGSGLIAGNVLTSGRSGSTQLVCADASYINVLKEVLRTAQMKKNRTGVDCLSIVGARIEFELSRGDKRVVPLLVGRAIPFKTVWYELVWFLRGSTDTTYLKEHNIKIWDANSSREYLDSVGLTSYEEGELGPVYGKQWRTFGGDQIEQLIARLRTDPSSRRHIVSAWNANQIAEMALPPCHMMFQIVVGSDDKLNIVVTQRSGDLFLGVPTNLASYGILCHMLGLLTGRACGKIVLNIGDAHLYSNHIVQAKRLIQTSEWVRGIPHPEIKFAADHDWSKLDADDLAYRIPITDVEVVDYYPYEKIDAEMAV